MASQHDPEIPESFERFGHATAAKDQGAEFYFNSGTFTGLGVTPARRAGEPFTNPGRPSGDEDCK